MCDGLLPVSKRSELWRSLQTTVSFAIDGFSTRFMGNFAKDNYEDHYLYKRLQQDAGETLATRERTKKLNILQWMYQVRKDFLFRTMRKMEKSTNGFRQIHIVETQEQYTTFGLLFFQQEVVRLTISTRKRFPFDIINRKIKPKNN